MAEDNITNAWKACGWNGARFFERYSDIAWQGVVEVRRGDARFDDGWMEQMLAETGMDPKWWEGKPVIERKLKRKPGVPPAKEEPYVWRFAPGEPDPREDMQAWLDWASSPARRRRTR